MAVRTLPSLTVDSSIVLDARTAVIRLLDEADGTWAGSLLLEEPDCELPPWLQVQLVDGDVVVACFPALATPFRRGGGGGGTLLRLSTSGSCYLERLVARFVELRQAAEATADEEGLDWRALSELTWITGELDRVINPAPGPTGHTSRRPRVIETTPPPR